MATHSVSFFRARSPRLHSLFLKQNDPTHSVLSHRLIKHLTRKGCICSDALTEVKHQGDTMDLLFKRDQTAGKIAKVQFKLWAKVELIEEEQALVRRYRFDDAILIAALQPNLIRNTAFVAVGAFLVVFAILSMAVASGFAMFLAVAAGVGAGYWFLNEKRETIFVKDLLHGRFFFLRQSC